MALVTEDYKKLKESMEAAQREFAESMEGNLKAATKELFEKYPRVKSVSWVQYTPYFSDGDQCTFSARTDEVDVVYEDDDGEEEELDYYSGRRFSGGKYVKDETDWGNFTREFIAMLKEVGDDILRSAFGDHVKVTVSRNGVETDDYDHD